MCSVGVSRMIHNQSLFIFLHIFLRSLWYRFVCPLEFVALMVWWVYGSVTEVPAEEGAQWYSFTRDSIGTAVSQVPLLHHH